MAVMPDVALKPGDTVAGFEIRAATPLPGLRAVACRADHPATGARLLHLHADDSENLFSVAFPTPPSDNTGLPHILEHSVLAGSRRFPVNDPFFEMIKMSMATFINAMTGPDVTYYPVASNNAKDLFNLAEVYFDAVFHPLLTEATFGREAHHLAPARPEDPTGDLTVRGIVYSEMKGAYSHPESILARHMVSGLFPDTVYGLDAGGDPTAIPDLTYEDLRRFHARFYHPGNALFFLYGNIPTRESLAFLGPRLAEFERREAAPPIARHPRWTQPRSLRAVYPLGPGEPADGRTYLALNWATGDAADPADRVAMDVLARLLLGHEAAPLKKALIDSDLGQDLIHAGAAGHGLEGAFHVGLKGSEADRADAFEALVLKTLADAADGALDPRRVEAALQQAAYHHLEIGRMYPIVLMSRVLDTWPYGADPLAMLRLDEHLAACREQSRRDPRFFGNLLRRRLVDNPHRLRVVLAPDREEQARRDAAFARRMAAVRAGLGEAERRRVAEKAADLERLASQANSPEALATLPHLQVADLPRAPRHVPTTVARVGGVEVLRNDVHANGVNYVHLDFDLTGLPPDLYAYLPHYGDAVRKLGAAGMNYERIAERAAAHTGGLGCSPWFQAHAADPGRVLQRMGLTVKALDGQVEPALALVHDLLFGLDPRDEARLRDVAVQAAAWCRSALVRDGHRTALRHAARGLTVEGHLAETVAGLPQLVLTQELSTLFGNRGPLLAARIEAVRDFLLNRRRLTVSFTGSPHAYDTLCRALERWAGAMRDEPVPDAAAPFAPYTVPPREGLAAPMDVAFCAMVLPAPHFSHPDEPLMGLGARMLSLDRLLPEIRFKGNAYGAGCTYDGLARTLALHSFRDPHIVETLDVFRGLLDYVRRVEWTPQHIHQALIGKAKEDDQPIRPEAATQWALARHVSGLGPDRREARYARLLAATPDAVRGALLELIEPNLERAAVCVVASRGRLEEANRRLADRPLAVSDLRT